MTTIRTWTCILLLWPLPLLADQASSSPQLRRGSIEMGGILGATVPVTWLHAHKDRNLVLGTFHVGRVMTDPWGFIPLRGTFELLFEVAPLLVLHQPEETSGVAASPLHLRWNFMPFGGGTLRGFAEGSGGVVYTGTAVPPSGTTLNFIEQVGFGLRLERHQRMAWVLGYRFQHISNGGREEPNPGTNFNLFYVGVSVLR